MSVIHHRRAGAATAAFLALSLAGCSGLGRNAVGTVAYLTPEGRLVTVANPLVTGCHRFTSAGAARITNRTLVDMVLYTTPDCTGHGTTYVATLMSDSTAPATQPWRSYTIVH